MSNSRTDKIEQRKATSSFNTVLRLYNLDVMKPQHMALLRYDSIFFSCGKLVDTLDARASTLALINPAAHSLFVLARYTTAPDVAAGITTSSEKDLRPGTNLFARSAHAGTPKRTMSTWMVALPTWKLPASTIFSVSLMNPSLLRFPSLVRFPRPIFLTACATRKLNEHLHLQFANLSCVYILAWPHWRIQKSFYWGDQL